MLVIYLPQKNGFPDIQDDFSCLVTFITSLDSLFHFAMRLERAVSLGNMATLNSTFTNTTSANSIHTHDFLKMQALSAVVGQVVTDGCNYVSYT